MSRVRSAAAVGWLAVSLVAGCTAATGGAPAGESTAAPGPTSSAPPVELTLDGIAPCDLITPEVQAQFEFYEAPSYLEGGDYLSQCTGTTVGFRGLGVGLAKTEGIANVSGAQQSPLSIGGLDSVEVRNRATSCTEAVGVNTTQSLRVVANQSSVATQDELCQSARQFAEVMVQNVRSLQGR